MPTTDVRVSPLAPVGAALLRWSLGVLFLVHGLTKLLVFTPAGTAAYFQSLGLPGALGYVALVLELTLAAALLLGVRALGGAAGRAAAAGHHRQRARCQWFQLRQCRRRLGIPGVLGIGAAGAVLHRGRQVDARLALSTAPSLIFFWSL